MREWLLCVLVVGVTSCGGSPDMPAPAPATQSKAAPDGFLETPFPLEPFSAVDLDGRDVSTSTWRGRVVVVNAWATWCAPCRREIPALVAIQDAFRDRVLIIGLLQDNVTTTFAREFGKTSRMNYPVVRSTFDIESRFPPVVTLPTTFLIDAAGRLVAMYAGELDPAVLRKDIETVLGRGRGSPGARPQAE